MHVPDATRCDGVDVVLSPAEQAAIIEGLDFAVGSGVNMTFGLHELREHWRTFERTHRYLEAFGWEAAETDRRVTIEPWLTQLVVEWAGDRVASVQYELDLLTRLRYGDLDCCSVALSPAESGAQNIEAVATLQSEGVLLRSVLAKIAAAGSEA